MTREERAAYFVPGMAAYWGRREKKATVLILSDEGDKMYGRDQNGNIVAVLETLPMVKVEVLAIGERESYLKVGQERLACVGDLEPVDPLTSLGATAE